MRRCVNPPHELKRFSGGKLRNSCRPAAIVPINHRQDAYVTAVGTPNSDGPEHLTENSSRDSCSPGFTLMGFAQAVPYGHPATEFCGTADFRNKQTTLFEG